VIEIRSELGVLNLRLLLCLLLGSWQLLLRLVLLAWLRVTA